MLDTIEFVSLGKDATCSDAPPDREASQGIDYSPGTTNPWVTHRQPKQHRAKRRATRRRGLRRCSFTGGKSVAQFVIEQMATRSEDTACGVIDLLLGTINVFGFLGEFAIELSLGAIGCDGEDIAIGSSP